MLPGGFCSWRRQPSMICMPVLKLWVPVTYETANRWFD